MKKKSGALSLITKIILLGIPLYLLMLYTYLFPLNYMPIEFSMWQQEKDYTVSGEAADTLIIGDSRAKSGILPLEVTSDEDAVYNMAIGGATPIEMYYALNRYLKHHDAPKRAIIIFAPYHMCDIDNWDQSMSFNYLSASELFQVYCAAAVTQDPIVLKKGALTDAVAYRFRLPNKYMSSLYNAAFIGRRADNTAKYDSVAKDLGYTVFGEADGDDNLNYETHHEVFDYSPLVISYYEKLIGLCEQNGIEIIIEQSPVNQASYDVLHPEFVKGYETYMTQLEEQYSNITVNKEIVPYPNSLFGDCNHLNRAGALRFTSEIKEKHFAK